MAESYDIAKAAQAIASRAEDRFHTQLDSVYRETDRIFAGLMVAQWIFAVILALWISPYGWAGKTQTINMHVPIAIFLGGLLSSVPIFLGLRRPGWVVTRHTMAVAQMLWSALLIHLTGGRIETHFHVFGSLGFLAFYRDWKVLVTATLVVVADHLARGMLWPESVYGIVNPEWWRFFEHAFWVVFIDSVLILSCLRGVKEMREISEQSAQLEAFAEGEWQTSSVLSRTAS